MRAGSRVDAIDLHHEDLPDPVVEMFRCLQRRMDRLEQRVAPSNGPVAGAESDANTAESDSQPISVEFDGQVWEI
jgi:hypothetical protein